MSNDLSYLGTSAVFPPAVCTPSARCTTQYIRLSAPGWSDYTEEDARGASETRWHYGSIP